jgi:hypothetical protein
MSQNNFFRTQTAIVGILILSLMARLVFLVIYPEPNFPDAVAYRTIGTEIFSGLTITNNIYMPLYPIWTFIFGTKEALIYADIGISVASVYLIYLLSIELIGNNVGSIVSCLIAAIYPHFIFYSVSGLSETLYIFLLLLIFLLYYKKYFFFAIIVSVLSILVRPTLDLLNPILLIIFIYFVHNLPWNIVFKYIGIYLISYVLIMSPWWIHQNQKYGDFVRLNLGDGIVLYSGNNPMNVSGGGVGRDLGKSDMDLSIFSNIDDPISKNNAMKQEAFNFIIQNPKRFTELAGVKFLRFWRLWPYAEEFQQWYVIASSLLSYGLVLILAIGYVVQNCKLYFRKFFPIFALIGYLTFVHMITIGSIRYRLPLEPFLIIFAGNFIFNLFKKFFIKMNI